LTIMFPQTRDRVNQLLCLDCLDIDSMLTALDTWRRPLVYERNRVARECEPTILDTSQCIVLSIALRHTLLDSEGIIVIKFESEDATVGVVTSRRLVSES
jgi:hypothetical protein